MLADGGKDFHPCSECSNDVLVELSLGSVEEY